MVCAEFEACEHRACEDAQAVGKALGSACRVKARHKVLVGTETGECAGLTVGSVRVVGTETKRMKRTRGQAAA